MVAILRIAASLIFAAHAILGCGMHRACAHGSGVEPHSAAHADHDACHEGHHSESSESSGEPAPADCCDEAACSFLKAEPTQVDPGAAMTLSGALAPTLQSLSAQFSRSAALATESRPNLAVTPLYVWHCALVI